MTEELERAQEAVSIKASAGDATLRERFAYQGEQDRQLKIKLDKANMTAAAVATVADPPRAFKCNGLIS